MSAEVLREAAERMSAHAVNALAATGSSDWFAVLRDASFGGSAVRSSGGLVAETSRFEAEHIAHWNPEVAMLVAGLLVTSAEAWDFDLKENGAGVADELALAYSDEVNLARAYLGATS